MTGKIKNIGTGIESVFEAIIGIIIIE